MKYVKILGLLAVAAAAMMAFAAGASADYLSTTTEGTSETPKIHAVNEGGHVTLKSGSVTIQCNSTSEGTPTEDGPGSAVIGPLSHLTFTGCTNFWHVTTEDPGKLAVEHKGSYEFPVGSGTIRKHDGTLFSTDAVVDTTRLGVTCVYETNNTHIGTVTGNNPATLHVKASIPINAEKSAEICGTTSTWEGNYVTTEALYVHNS